MLFPYANMPTAEVLSPSRSFEFHYHCLCGTFNLRAGSAFGDLVFTRCRLPESGPGNICIGLFFYCNTGDVTRLRNRAGHKMLPFIYSANQSVIFDLVTSWWISSFLCVCCRRGRWPPDSDCSFILHHCGLCRIKIFLLPFTRNAVMSLL